MQALLWICLTFGYGSPECQAGYRAPAASIEVDDSEARYERRRARARARRREKREARSGNIAAAAAAIPDGDAITRQTVQQPVPSILWRLVYGPCVPCAARFAAK